MIYFVGYADETLMAQQKTIILFEKNENTDEWWHAYVQRVEFDRKHSILFRKQFFTHTDGSHVSKLS